MRWIGCGLFIVGLLFAAGAGADDDWTQQFPASAPSARQYHSMAYIGGGKALLFGGWVGSNDDETWLYDVGANTWTEMFPASEPSERREHAMAYIGDNQVLLFGGYDDSGRDDETWIYDLSDSTWTQLSPVSKPSPRYAHRMAYIGDEQVLLFGGNTDAGSDDETWIYDLSDSTWTQKAPSSKPSARKGHAMACIGDDQVLLFGGDIGAPYFRDDETWIFDLSDSTWTQMNPISKPSARRAHAMACLGGDRALLFGGFDGSSSDETWVYDLGDDDWTLDVNASQPSPRFIPGLSETSMDGSTGLALFGGTTDSGSDDETWTYYPVPDAPLVTVIYPNGGEVLTDSATITWMASDSDPGETILLLVDLDYSANAGTTWSVIDSNQANDSAYLWDIPGLYSGAEYLIRISATDTTGLSGSDTSDAVFTIDGFDYPQVTVTYPNGGEILADSATITWSASDQDPGETALLLLDLDYSANAGTTWSVIDSNQVNDSTYVWDISGLPDGFDYLVRIVAVDTMGLSAGDTSDAVFAIYIPDLPQVTVVYPDGGEILGDSATVTWTASDPDPGETALLLVDLEYSEDAGVSWSVIDTNQANDGSYFWDLYGLYSDTDYLVCITAIDTTGLFDADSSAAVFTIRNPDPHISSIADVPEDQGREVAVMWDRSHLDEYPNQVITYYSIWRKFPEGSKIEFLADEWDGTLPKNFDRRVYRRIETEDASQETKYGYWELVGSQEAHYLEGYSYCAPTLYDSSASGPGYFSFFVSAQTDDPFVFWDSRPDSGYSVDDVNPAKTQISIAASGGAKGSVHTVWLSWVQVTTGEDGSPEQGPIDYRVYCDEAYDFVPGPGNLVATTTDLLYVHTDGRIGDPAANLFYLVTAVDGSGNESAVSNVVGEFDLSLSNAK